MLLQVECNGTVDFVFNTVPGILKITLGSESKLLRGSFPYNAYKDRLLLVAVAHVEGNGGLGTILYAEHLGSLGVDAFGKYFLADQGIDKGGFACTVGTNHTEVDIVLIQQHTLFFEFIFSDLEGGSDLRVHQLFIKNVQSLVTELTDTVIDLNYGRDFDKVHQLKTNFPGDFVVCVYLFHKILIVNSGTLEGQINLVAGELFPDIIEETIALILQQKLTELRRVACQMGTGLIGNLQIFASYLGKKANLFLNGVIHNHKFFHDISSRK